MTFADILDRAAARHPHKVALKSETASIEYAKLRNRVNSLATSLLALGLRKGDRIAILAPNCHQYVEMYLLADLAGIILVPLNTRLSSEELEFIVNDCQPAAIVVDQDFIGCFERMRPRLTSVSTLVHIGRPFDGSLDYEDLAQRAVPPLRDRAKTDDVNCILYTGGTTGFPKGAMLSNRSWLANTANTLPVVEPLQEDVNLVMTPLFHTAAVWPVLLHLYVGATSVTMRKFEVKPVFETMERERVTFCHPVSAQVISLLEEPSATEYDLSSFRTIQCTMSLPVPAFQRALKVFGNKLMPGYGLTEAGPMALLMRREEMADWELLGGPQSQHPRTFGSSGRALPNVQVKLTDEAGREVARGEIGEITVKSESLMLGYWNRPDATAKALRDGWLYTGDMARMDEQGLFYFVDRKSGMIKTGGESVYPKEVEDAIAAHPAVLEVAVFGVPDVHWGETVKAVVALRRDAQASADEIIEHCRHRIASYKKPTSIEFVETLPRNPSGKVIKAELRAKYLNRESGVST